MVYFPPSDIQLLADPVPHQSILPNDSQIQGYKWTPSVPLSFSNTTTTSQTPQPQPNPESNKKKKNKHPPSHPCSHWYPGNRPFQAPEVHHIATYMETLPNLKAFVDLRSYGQMRTHFPPHVFWPLFFFRVVVFPPD